MPKISIILPTFNRSAVLLRAIHSVLNQSHKNWELIVVDDGSTDPTEELLSPWIRAATIRYFKQKNCGVSSARNFGVQQSSGDWITFLDSDDEWLPNKLISQLDFFRTNPELTIVYGQEIWIRNGKRVNQKAIHKKEGGWIFERCMQQCLIAPSSVMIKKSLFQEMGGFDEDFIVCEDYDLWLKISSLYEIGYIPEPLIVKYGGHDDQLSTKYVAMDRWRIKSLARILKIRTFDEASRQRVVLHMKAKGAQLMQGYLKHGNQEAYSELAARLENLN